QVFAAWATAAFFPFAALCGGLAFALLDRSSQRIGWRHLVAATLLLTMGLTIYQPAAMFFWVFAAIPWIYSDAEVRGNALIQAVAVMVLALGLDFGIAKLLTALYLPEWANLSRTALAWNIPAKLIWFVSEPLF